jgi:hypothetical protein
MIITEELLLLTSIGHQNGPQLDLSLFLIFIENRSQPVMRSKVLSQPPNTRLESPKRKLK